ncbi:MAG: endonuclease domain-containing protein, partial [Bosea sp. (in: a-proteobacteria)]
TEAERKLWRIVRNRRFSGFKFRRQVPMGPYIVDLVCMDRRLIVEADGGQHAENPYDAARDRWFEAHGFRIRRFWNADIFNATESVIETLWHDLDGFQRIDPSDTAELRS